MDPGNWPRLWKLGGLAFPGHSDGDEYVKRVARVPAAVDAVRVRLGLRRRPRRPVRAARRRRRREHRLPVQEPRRRGHVRPPEDRRAHVRLHEGGRRALRALRRLVRRPAPRRRPAAGAATCGTAPRRTWRCGSAPTASARRRCVDRTRRDPPPRAAARCGSAPTGRRCCARAGQPQQRGPSLELVRARRRRRRRGRAHAPRPRRAGRQHRDAAAAPAASRSGRAWRGAPRALSADHARQPGRT